MLKEALAAPPVGQQWVSFGSEPLRMVMGGWEHSSLKELFSPGQEAAGARPSRAQVKNISFLPPLTETETETETRQDSNPSILPQLLFRQQLQPALAYLSIANQF